MVPFPKREDAPSLSEGSILSEQIPVGVIGPTGSGKSQFCRKMEEIGARFGMKVHHIDYDTLAHDIYNPRVTPSQLYENVRKELETLFPWVRGADGTINRAGLRKYVFESENKKENLAKLNRLVGQAMRLRYGEIIAKKSGLILVDAALLGEHGLTHLVNHACVLITADKSLRVERILNRSVKDGKPLSREQVESQISAQSTMETMRAKLLSIVEEKKQGFVMEFDNTNPSDAEYEAAFEVLLKKLGQESTLR